MMIADMILDYLRELLFRLLSSRLRLLLRSYTSKSSVSRLRKTRIRIDLPTLQHPCPQSQLRCGLTIAGERHIAFNSMRDLQARFEFLSAPSSRSRSRFRLLELS